LVDGVVRWATERPGIDRIVLRVTETNGDAARSYASCRFAATDDPPEPLRDGSELRTRRLERPLTSV